MKKIERKLAGRSPETVKCTGFLREQCWATDTRLLVLVLATGTKLLVLVTGTKLMLRVRVIEGKIM